MHFRVYKNNVNNYILASADACVLDSTSAKSRLVALEISADLRVASPLP